MIENTDHSAQSAQSKQGETRVSNPVELTKFLEKHVEGWAETKKKRLDALLLLALCRLSIAQYENSATGFDAQTLAGEVGRLHGKSWTEAFSKAEAGEKVREFWKKLQTLWEQKFPGLSKAAFDAELTMLVVPQRDDDNSGGRGNTTHYRLIAQAIQQEPSNVEVFPMIKPPGTVEYIPEDSKDANWFVRGLVRGVELSGWKKWLFIFINIAALLICLAVFWVMLLIIARAPSFLNGLDALWICSPVILGLWFTFSPFFYIFEKRYTSLPWLFDFDSNLLICLEGDKKPYKIRAIHFSGECPFCGGKVHVGRGGFEFYGKIIGRCDREPRAHVFSFDYARKIGRPIGDVTRGLMDTLP